MLEERHREAQRIRLEEIRLKYLIKERLHPRYSNWRSLFESQMGTVGCVQTFVKGEGETDLATIDSSDEGSYAAPVGMSSAFVGTGITANGSGIGTTGGFDVGGPYLGFELGTPYPPSPPARWAAMAAIDASEYDTIVLRAIRGTGSNGGEAPTSTNQGLQLWYQLPGGDMVSIDTNPDGETDPNVDKYVVPAGSEDLGLTDWSITIPSYARKADVRFVLYQSDHNGEGSDNYGITKVFYRRQNPISLFVSLDSPEATSFVSVGQGPERTSPKKRRKKTEGQLRATQKYTDKKFGKDFPASKTTLEPDPPDAGDVYPQRNIDQAQRATGDKIGSGTDGTVEPFTADAKAQAEFDSTYKPTKADPFGKPTGNSQAAFNAWAKAKDAELKRQHRELVTKAGYGWTLGTAARNFQDSTYVQFSNYPPGTPEHALSQAITALWKSAQDAHNAYGKQIGKGGEKKDFTWDELMARDAAGEDPYGTAWGGKEPTDAQEPTDAEGELSPETEKALADEGAPKGLGRIVAGLKDLFTGNKSDFDKRGSLLDGVERMFPQSQQAAARQFLAYLTNKPGQVKYSPAEVKSAFSGLDVNPAGNNLSVSGDSLGMQNVIGGESLNNLQVKGNNVVLNYNYDVQNSVDEFGQGRYGEMYKDNPIKLLALAYGDALKGGQYGADTREIPGAGWLVTAAKNLGGGKPTKGSISISLKDLKTMYNKGEVNKFTYDYILKKADQAKRKSYSIDDPVVAPNERKKKVTEATSTKKRLKKPSEIFNPRGDIKPVYPDTPPPKMVNGWHPEYGKAAKRFNRLDPISARSMPKTGDPEIDAKVRKAARKPK